MLLLIVLIFILFNFSFQQSHHDCFDHVFTFNAHVYLSTPNFPKTLSWSRRSDCYFEFKNPKPILLIFTNAYLCDVRIKTNKNVTLIPILDTNTGYYQFEGRFFSMHLLSNFDKTDPKCDWQAFQAFAYDPTIDNFHPLFSEVFNNDLIYSFATLNNLKYWIMYNNLSGFITYKMVVGYNLNSNDSMNITIGSYHMQIAETLKSSKINNLLYHDQNSNIHLEFNSNFEQKSSFHFFVCFSNKRIEWNSNCIFEELNLNEWKFSLYNKTSGYERNTHCGAVLHKLEGYQYKLWFEQYHVEPHFDNVTVETFINDDPVKLKNSKYIVPYTDFLLKFDSDGSINQAGFILHIEKFACICDDSMIILPCDGSAKRHFIQNFDNPFLFCNIRCILQIQFEKNCIANFFEIYLQRSLPSLFDVILQYTHERFLLKNRKLLLYNDPLANYFIIQQYLNDYRIHDLGDSYFWLDFKIPLNLEFMTIVLNSTNWIFYEKLTNLEKIMISVQMDHVLQNENYTFEFFVVFTNYEQLENLDFYQNSFKEYKGSFTNIISPQTNYIEPFMVSWKEEFSFHFENFYPGDDGIVFIRIKELDIKNCMFEHNVIDVGTFTDKNNFHPFTMINNGTGLCKSTVLNIWKNDFRGFYNFWTTLEESVVILDRNQKAILKFNKRNANEIPQLKLDDIYYEVHLPSNSSVTFQGFRTEN